MRFRYIAVPLSMLGFSVPISHFPSAISPVWAQAAPPRQALITGVRGREVTLGVGAMDGAQQGAVYGIVRGGRVAARVQIIDARANESTARIIEADNDFVLAVGDTGTFIAVQELPAETPVNPPVVVPPVVEPPVVEPPVVVPPVENPGTVVPPVLPSTTPIANTTETSIAVINVEGERVTFGAGENRGVRSGAKVPIVRNGDVVGIARITVVEATQSRGEILYSDATSGGVQIGDGATILNATAPNTFPVPNTTVATIDGVPQTDAPIPSTPVRYETGASNAVVPQIDETYELLAALAASKLITRYPAHVFRDDGRRRHRSEEDITFSRAQIADLVREAIGNAQTQGDENLSSKERTALSILGSEYRDELAQLGVTTEALAATGANRKFSFGYSGQSRASLVLGSAKDGGSEPFSEAQGGRRTRSGFDSRTNIFARYGQDLKFFAQIEGGSDTRRGSDDGGLDLRRLFVEYNAQKLARGLTLKAGRDEVWWGPGHFGTLLLGDTSGPLNTLQASFKRGSYQLDGLYAPLDRGPLGGRRSLYGHNLQVKIGSQTRIGIAETLLLPKDTLDPIAFISTFSPIPLFTVERLRKRNTAADNGNALVQAYIETSLARGVRGWGELLVDDIGVNSNNLVRNRIGSLVGVHLFDPKDPAKLGVFAEYANLQGRTYLALQAISDSDYFYRNRPLGYPVAPPQNSTIGGAESLRLDAYWRVLPKLRVGGGIEFADLYSEQANLSRQQILRLRAAYDLSQTITLVARVQRVSTDRVGGVNGPTEKRNLLQFEVVRAF